jgi:hypothetical protein
MNLNSITRNVLQQDRPPVRPRDHDGLQPVPGPSAAQTGVRQGDEEEHDIVRQHGARPVFFMSWAYADKPEMTAQLAEAYTKAGNDNDALVIPAGLAFANSVKQRPELNLYAPDKRTPASPARISRRTRCTRRCSASRQSA